MGLGAGVQEGWEGEREDRGRGAGVRLRLGAEVRCSRIWEGERVGRAHARS